MFLEVFNNVAKLHNKDEMEKAYEMFFSGSEKLHSFSLKEKTFDKIFDGFQSRVMQREFNKLNDLNKRVRIRFHIDELDFLIKGAETGEAVLFLGDSGVGKSFLLAWCGMAAARQGYKVAHFQAEGTKEQCLDRYDSAFTGVKYWDIKENNISDERMSSIKKVLNNKGRGDIIVEAFEKFESHTMVDIRNSIKEIKKVHPDLRYVVLDYLELVDPGDGKKYAPSEERFRQAKIGRAIKDIAVEENVVFITATQANSIKPEDLENPNFVITRFNLSEDKGKTRPFDLFITINQTREEKKENIVRLYIDKAREHASKQVITMYQNLAHSRFYDRNRTLNDFFTDDRKEEIELAIQGKKPTKLLEE
jgi:replicative DNA helicase